MQPFNNAAGAAVAFVILYGVLFLFLCVLYARKLVKWKSRYTVIFIHVVLRVGAQVCGLAFALAGWKVWQLLIAYLVLGAEGYFTLILCAFYYLVNFEKDHRGLSPLEPPMPQRSTLKQRLRVRLGCHPFGIIHNLLITANAIIVSGGSLMGGAYNNDDPDWGTINAGSIMRTTGTAIFLAIAQYFVYCLWGVYRRCHILDRTFICIAATYPFLTVRGVFGILNACVQQYNYYNPDIYTADGIGEQFLLAEYLMGTTMEWIACVLLLSTYFGHRKLMARQAQEQERNGVSDHADSDKKQSDAGVTSSV